MAKDRSRNDKGILLEQVVAMLHQVDGVSVETNVKLPVKSGRRRKPREIDVLLTAQVADYPVRIAIQCKNYGEKITVGQVGEFRDLLEDVGIPYQHGIIVSVNGFQSGAIERASELGMRTFELDGLTADRLSAEVRKAFQFFVYLLAQVTSLTIRNEIPPGTLSGAYAVSFGDHKNRFRGLALDLIASEWRKGEIPATLGSYEREFKIPDSWIQTWNGLPIKTDFVKATVAVSAQYIVRLEGNYKRFSLRKPKDQKAERTRIEADFSASSESQVLTENFRSEEDLSKFLGGLDLSIVHRFKLPRVLFNALYYPLSNRAIAILRSQAEQLSEEEFLGQRPITFEDIEGQVAGSIHEEPWRGFPALVADKGNNLIDLRMLLEDEKYMQILGFRKTIEANPTAELLDVLHLANLAIGRQILGKD